MVFFVNEDANKYKNSTWCFMNLATECKVLPKQSEYIKKLKQFVICYTSIIITQNVYMVLYLQLDDLHHDTTHHLLRNKFHGRSNR